jgi:DNA-binding MarR family transcriptional regulator
MHKIVSALDERRLVERRSGPDGGRALDTYITPTGEQLLARIEPLRREAEDRVVGVLDPSEHAEFNRLLRVVARVDR